MAKAQSFWDEKYQSRPFRNTKAPSEFLVQMIGRMQKGKVLDIAMGEGTNAVYLAQKGFQVKGFDISPVAIDHALALASETGISIETKCVDLDMYLMGLLEYDSIVMTYFKPAFTRYYSEIIRSMKQGGTLLVESYSTLEMKEPLSKEDAYRNFYFESNELLRNIAPLRILFYQEGLVGKHHVVQCLAQKPSDKHAAKYDLFGMHTNQKNGEKSKHLELAEQLFKK